MQGELRHDGSRFTSLYNRRKNYLRILMQQGRVQLDADWNEQVDTLLYHLQTLTSDLVGPHGGPYKNVGFEIRKSQVPPTPPNAVAPEPLQLPNDFVIGSGHYYVDGILCTLNSIPVPLQIRDSKASIPTWAAKNHVLKETDYISILVKDIFPYDLMITKVDNNNLEKDSQFVSITTAPTNKYSSDRLTSIFPLTTYRTQPYYKDVNKTIFPGQYVVYLDVWERHVTSIEDADERVPGIREVALGGTDTATRSQIVWQVKLQSTTSDASTFLKDHEAFLKEIKDISKPGQGHLIAKATKPDEGKNDPCLIAPESKYRGSENQLYRVEIFSISTNIDSISFVWSRENSAVVFPVLSVGTSNNSTIVVLEHLGYDSRFSLSEGDFVEMVDDDYVWQERTRQLLKVVKLDVQERQVWLSGSSVLPVDTQLNSHPYLRRWDSNVTTIPLGDEWVPLENGIEIKFDPKRLKSYRVGDYWMLPARTATGDVEWPGSKDNPLPLLPHGTTHHYAPLAVIKVDGGIITEINDCRREFTPLWSPV
ncbi:MAG: DUF6519 domain-containing protein, partial [Kovacikia sp.]